jgi:hypothetical protein
MSAAEALGKTMGGKPAVEMSHRTVRPLRHGIDAS